MSGLISSESAACVVSPTQSSQRQDTISPADSKRLPFSCATKSSGWVKRDFLADQRLNFRSDTAFPVEVQALDRDLQPIGAACEGILINYSQAGACLEHPVLLTGHYVQISWQDGRSRSHTAILKLRWCRWQEDSCYQSGGRVVGMR